MMSTVITIADLLRVPPVISGLDKMKAAIDDASRVWCICAAGRDYHVGAQDAKDTLTRAVERGKLRTKDAERQDDRIFVPQAGATLDEAAIEELTTAASNEVRNIYALLKRAYPGYDPTVARLREQGERIHDSLITAFRKLAAYYVLPPTVGSSAFNHQGLVMIMRQCFSNEDAFIEYLRNPDIFSYDPSNRRERILRERLSLLHKKFLEGALTKRETERLREISDEVMGLFPVVTEEEVAVLDDIAIDLSRVRERNIERKKKARQYKKKK